MRAMRSRFRSRTTSPCFSRYRRDRSAIVKTFPVKRAWRMSAPWRLLIRSGFATSMTTVGLVSIRRFSATSSSGASSVAGKLCGSQLECRVAHNLHNGFCIVAHSLFRGAHYVKRGAHGNGSWRTTRLFLRLTGWDPSPPPTPRRVCPMPLPLDSHAILNGVCLITAIMTHRRPTISMTYHFP